MNYSELFSDTVKEFPRQDAALDIQLLLEAAFNITRTDFFIKKNDPVTNSDALNKFRSYLRLLEQNVPVAYILGSQEFYSELFLVDENVLIPRPETEILVERAAGFIDSPAKILDIGAGSGIISIMLAKLTGSHVTAVDISPCALAVLKKNIALHHVEDRVFPLLADLFPGNPIPNNPAKTQNSQNSLNSFNSLNSCNSCNSLNSLNSLTSFDMIVSNPPYIPVEEWRELEPCVKEHEPQLALTADENGLNIIRRIIDGAHNVLKPGGLLLMEIGYNQSQPVKELLENAGFSNIEFFNDYSKIPRIACGRLET
ncbi:MAG: peptide chain release factor N(5)-glutamine methyltransferase [bacterium]|nr:peptide chain release factor N(5)-glutamine methyltransferase [bacterium]